MDQEMDSETAMALEKLTPAQASDMVDDPLRMHWWIAESGLVYSRALVREIWQRAEGADEGAGPGDARRTDAEQLREFVQRAARLPPRLRQVASLCLDHGVSLTECARRLGISRNTVRSHLARLRALERQWRARQAQIDALEVQAAADHESRSIFEVSLPG